MCGTFNNRVRKDTKIKQFKMMAVPKRNLGTKGLNKFQSTEAKFLRTTQGYTVLNKVKNKDIKSNKKLNQ